MTPADKRAVIEALLCAAADENNVALIDSMRAVGASLELLNEVNEESYRVDPVDKRMAVSRRYARAAYRLIESLPSLQREWFGAPRRRVQQDRQPVLACNGKAKTGAADVVAAINAPPVTPLPTGAPDRADVPCGHPPGEIGPCSGGGGNSADPVQSADTVTAREDASASPPCTDYAPFWFTGHWRDWHRGHGCDLDDSKARSTEGAAEIAYAADRRPL